jgi:hypothetical protein
MGIAIEQVSEAMESGPQLSIEWNPGSSFSPHIVDKTIPFDKYAYSNPFHGVEDMAVYFNAAYALFKDKQYRAPVNMTHLLPQIRDRAVLMRSALEHLHTATLSVLVVPLTLPLPHPLCAT